MFKFPRWRDFIMAGGVCDVSKESIRHIVAKQGTGNAAVIVVGGAAESLLMPVQALTLWPSKTEKDLQRWLFKQGKENKIIFSLVFSFSTLILAK